MTTGLIITGYLALGAITATIFYFAVSESLKSNTQADRDALATLEKSVETFPGGMPAVLMMLLLIWPVAVVNVALRHRS